MRFAEVRGTPPSYGVARLRDYPGRQALCQAMWNPRADQGFTPQSVAIAGDVAYVGGYRWRPAVSTRNCQLLAIDLRTFAVIGFVERFQASVYRPHPTYCRHGGGMQVDEHGIWVMETQRMWLLDPRAIRESRDPVLRWWRLGPGLRGSAMALHEGRVGVAGYRAHRRAHLRWFDQAGVLRRGVRDLVLTGASGSAVAPVRRGWIPAKVQGATSHRGLWLSGSAKNCSFIQTPRGRRVAAPPGIEGI